MAKSNLLKTQDVTFLELIGNGKKYRVPSFQRDYAWEEEQWEDLWNDIIELRDVPGSFHYMCALVVEASSDRQFQIIDGQQRVATLSMLALAVIHRLKTMPGDEATQAANADRAAQLRNRFIGEKDPASLLESSKLFLNDTDDGFLNLVWPIGTLPFWASARAAWLPVQRMCGGLTLPRMWLRAPACTGPT